MELEDLFLNLVNLIERVNIVRNKTPSRGKSLFIMILRQRMNKNSNLPIKPSDEGRQRASDLTATITAIILGIMAGLIVWPAGLVHDTPVPGLIIMAFVAGLTGAIIQEPDMSRVQFEKCLDRTDTKEIIKNRTDHISPSNNW
ncbi:uncharacterized protein LOC123556626 isoform X2 [Mercenaria mercenaria]|uniref:uncharacterized protein LOC123556626 isoform X2 n=1 Tax=Mercenaria mercenaria TaxID=6596 RepID=UPI001E1DB703|nr:uncharacterized protein LOC123556626 isoform X2 [Mercenaria mercenaria]